jgi:hypothetical protein
MIPNFAPLDLFSFGMVVVIAMSFMMARFKNGSTGWLVHRTPHHRSVKDNDSSSVNQFTTTCRRRGIDSRGR